MININNPFQFIDTNKDQYRFYFFVSNAGVKHISISIQYATIKGNALGIGFSQPIISGKINWNVYPSTPGVGRQKMMSKEAIQVAEKLVRLKAFL